MPPRCPRGRTSRRRARSAAVHSSSTSQHEQHQRAGDVEAVGQERPVAGVRALLGLHPADGQDHLVGLAREQVAAARAAVGQQSDAGRQAALDLRAVGGGRARHQRAGLLLHPPERRDVLVGSEQDPGLARAGLRRQVRLPLDEAVAVPRDPARHRRSVAVAHRPAQDRQREPVDLEEDDARRCPCRRRAWRRAIRRTTRSV